MYQQPLSTGTPEQSPIPAAPPPSGDVVINIGSDCSGKVESPGSPSDGSTELESSPPSNSGRPKKQFVENPEPYFHSVRKSENIPFGQAASSSEIVVLGTEGVPKARRMDTQQEIVDKHPMGYPRLAAFMESDESFKMYRQFGYAHTRVLLHLQCEVAEMETRLKDMDERDARDEDRKMLLQSHKRNSRADPERGILLSEFRAKLKEYDELLLLSHQLSAVQRPSPRSFKSLSNYVNNEKPLVARESHFINHGEDFISMVNTSEAGWLDELIERVLCRWPCWPLKFVFMSPEQKNKTDNKFIHYYDRNRISTLVRLIITITAAVILIIPVFVLFGTSKTTSGMTKVLIIFLFTLAFAAALAVSTQAKKHEIFAATAA